MPRSQSVPPYLTTEQLTRDLALRDLTYPAAGPHAIQSLVGLATDALMAAWACPPRPSPGPRIVPMTDNYDNLGFTAGAASRDARYTRYVDAQRILRSHSSAMVPPALRALAADPLDDVLLVCPGIVYRRDAIDRLHTGTPHQLDLWRVSRRPLTDADMDEMITLLVDALAPGRRWRAEPRIHPYTVHGRQVDVRDGHAWVEVWECGLAHPDVLTRAGLAGWHGLALGLGLDRLLMLCKHIPDIRLLRSADPRVAGQMIDLAPYRAISAMPAVMRDLSVAVDVDDDVERLGDLVRDALAPTPPPSRRSLCCQRPPTTSCQRQPSRAWACTGATRTCSFGSCCVTSSARSPTARPTPCETASTPHSTSVRSTS
jgi:phenylalanyl-tRNA synthetase alpha chain